MTQRPCRVGDTVRFINGGHRMHWVILRADTCDRVNINRESAPFVVVSCGQCGKAVPSECRCFEDSETGVE